MAKSHSAESGDSGSSESGASKIRTDYDKAISHIKLAKKYEKKDKIKKANKRYQKALKLLIKSNEKKPNNPDTLNYLGIASKYLINILLNMKNF